MDETERANYTPEGKLIPEIKEILDPKKTALIIIDMQGSYCDPTEILPTLLESDTSQLQNIVPKLERFIGQARRNGLPVIWTRMIEDPNHMSDNLSLKMRVENTPPLSTPGTKGFDYYQLVPQEGDLQVDKTHYNAFTGTDLDNYLREREITTVILAGGYTSRCVSATALIAADHLGYNVVVPSDLVGVPEKFAHEQTSTLNVINAILGFVIESQGIIDAWNESKTTTIS